MRTFKLVVSYDGTDFHGWQVQPRERTVQGVLEAALREVLGEASIRLAGAGRTDAGVHARGQVASFETLTRLPARALAPLVNPRLPRDLRMRSVEEVDATFHARHRAVARRYAYRLVAVPDIMAERFCWCPPRGFDPDRLALATGALEGEWDCSAFRATGSSPANPWCRISRASWSTEGAVARLDIIADHFLYHMVRTIVGTALRVANSIDPAGAMRAVLDSRDRARAGNTAPAHGLCLEEVFYPMDAA